MYAQSHMCFVYKSIHNECHHSLVNTVNDKSLEWLKFGGFDELIKFAKLSSANLLGDHKMFVNFVVDSPNFYPPKCLRTWLAKL